MADRIVRAISTDGMVQAAAICSRDLTERARQIHKTLPVATAALGRTLAAASMMGNALKSDGASLTLQFKGGGPLGTVLAVIFGLLAAMAVFSYLDASRSACMMHALPLRRGVFAFCPAYWLVLDFHPPYV